MDKKRNRLSIRDMALCALFAALTAAGAFIKIPIGVVPITLQLLFTNLAGLLLGRVRGIVSVALYIFIGLIGIPVFTGGGGLAYVLMPSFGYLIGMALGAFVAGAIAEKNTGRVKACFLAGAANIVVVYAIGVLYFYIISKFYLGKDVSARTLIISCCLVFIPGDAASCVLGAFIAKRLRPLVDNLR